MQIMRVARSSWPERRINSGIIRNMPGKQDIDLKDTLTMSLYRSDAALHFILITHHAHIIARNARNTRGGFGGFGGLSTLYA